MPEISLDNEEKEPSLDPLLQLVKSYGAAGITGALDILGKIVEAIGRVAEGIAANPDPISQVVSLILVSITINYFLTTEPYKSVLAKTKIDVLLHSWQNYIVTLPLDLINAIGKGLGRDDANGTWGIAELDNSPFQYYVSGKFRWYTNEVSRDAALVILSIVEPLHVSPVTRTFFTPQGGGRGETISPPSPGELHDRAKGKSPIPPNIGPSATGKFCILFPHRQPDANLQCYDTVAERDNAFDIITRSNPELDASKKDLP